jgi:hypothetical protein
LTAIGYWRAFQPVFEKNFYKVSGHQGTFYTRLHGSVGLQLAVNTLLWWNTGDDTGMWYNKEEFLRSPEAKCLVTESYKTWFSDIAVRLEEVGSTGELNYESDQWMIATLVE